MTANDFSSRDEKLLSILQDLQQSLSFETNSSSKRIAGYFCSNMVFNLSLKASSDTKINIPEKGLDLLRFRIKLMNQN